MKSKQWFLILVMLTVLIFPEVMKGQGDKAIPQNRFQVAIYNGTIANRSTLLAGTYSPETALSFAHGVRFNYERLLSERISLQAGWGLGFQATNFLVYPADGYPGNLGWGYGLTAKYSMFQEMRTQIGYRLPIAIRPEIRLVTGGGVVQSGSVGFSLWGYDAEDREAFRLDGAINGGFSPYISWGAQALFPLKNRNRLTLNLGYKYHFTDWYTGTYRMHEGTSYGLIHGSGSGFQLGIGYMFTGEKRVEKLQSIQKEYGSKKEAHKALRKAQRIIDPGAKFLSFYGGGCFLQYTVDDPNNLFVNYYYTTLKPRISFEYGLGDGVFLETGYYYTKYEADALTFLDFRERGERYSQGGQIEEFRSFYIHNLSLGIGYRFTTKNRLPILNVQAGMFSGFQAAPTGDNGQGNGSIQYSYSCGVDSCSDDFLFYNFTSRISSHLTIGVYGAISRDFRLADKLYLSFKYQYQMGFNTLAQTDYHYLDTGSGITGTAVGTFRNTGHAGMIGIRFLW